MKKSNIYTIKEINPDLVKVFLNRDKTRDLFELTSVAPLLSGLEDTLEAYYEATDIPLQLPFVSYLHIISTLLIRNDSKLHVKGAKIKPTLWSIALAESGAGKTLSFDVIEESARKVLGFGADFTQPGSDRAFLEMMQFNNNSLWCQDEYAKFLKKMETDGTPESAIKDQILKAYSGSTISKTTAKYSIVIEDPTLSILGLNSPQDFLDTISEKSLADGTGQRFTYWYADDDPDRDYHSLDYAFYNMGLIRETVDRAMERIASVSLHADYTLSDDGYKAYLKGYEKLIKFDLSKSFKRRIMFNSFKLAMIYHIILQKDNDVIDAEDMAWAIRLTRYNMNDLARLLDHYNYSDLERTIQKAEQLHKKNPNIKARDLVSGIRRIRSVSEAKQILSLLEGFKQPSRDKERRTKKHYAKQHAMASR